LDNILPAYNDPLFSIIIIITLILIVAVTSFILGNIKESNQKRTLKEFLQGFNRQKELLEIEEMPFEPTLIKPLSLLAQAFTNQGEYQKAINLNLYLIHHIENFFDKEHLLQELGETYLKAGFLKRSESIFLEILHKHPRNTKALYNLEIVYELLHEHEKALETIVPLQVMGNKTDSLEAHLKLSKLLHNKELSSKEKVEELQNFLTLEKYPYRPIMRAFFALDLEVAWSNIQTDKIHSILDILWFLPSSNLNLDIISANKTLTAIYVAKGVIPLKESLPKSDIFAIDTIVSAKNGGNESIDLRFSYGCEKCKQHFPISFTRCPKCYAIDSIQIKETLAKKESKTGYSLL